MSYYKKIDAVRTAVGIVEDEVVAAQCGRGEDNILLVIENLSLTEVFTATVQTSPNGMTQWSDELTDEFVDVPAGRTRRFLVPHDRIYARLLGNFVGAPDYVRISVFMLPAPKMWAPLGVG